MSLDKRRRIAGAVLGCSPKRVRFDTQRLSDIKDAITKEDMRVLVREGAVSRRAMVSIARGRARALRVQKIRGQRKGHGSRKGAKTARTPSKRLWVDKVRSQRLLLDNLRSRGVIDKKVYRQLYSKLSGGFFRSKRHVMLYVDEQGLRSK